MKRLILLLLILLNLVGCSNKPEFMWLRVINKDLYPDFDGCYRYRFAVTMISEDNKVVTAVDYELYNLVQVGDTLSAKVQYLKTENWNTKLYRVTDIEIINRNGVWKY